MASDIETVKMKVIGIEKLNNFVVDIFSFQIIYAWKIIFEFLHV